VSALAEIITTPSMRTARANWRAQQWRARKRQQRLADEAEAAARMGMLSWAALRSVPIEEGTPGPARQCQWIEHGCFCNEPSVLGKSWCEAHCARVFAAEGESPQFE
jgi:hypothetical protein